MPHAAFVIVDPFVRRDHVLKTWERCHCRDSGRNGLLHVVVVDTLVWLPCREHFLHMHEYTPQHIDLHISNFFANLTPRAKIPSCAWSLMLLLFISLVVFPALYLLGVRFVGKPMAVYSWRYWHESPEMSPTVASTVLFPFVHAVQWFEGEPFSRDVCLPKNGRPEPFVPIIASWSPEAKSAYIQHASWAWPLRLLGMTLMNATWLMIVTAAALRWIIRGPIGSRVLGNVE